MVTPCPNVVGNKQAESRASKCQAAGLEWSEIHAFNVLDNHLGLNLDSLVAPGEWGTDPKVKAETSAAEHEARLLRPGACHPVSASKHSSLVLLPLPQEITSMSLVVKGVEKE